MPVRSAAYSSTHCSPLTAVSRYSVLYSLVPGPDKCLPVYYERLVIDTKKQMERILEFVGVPWDDYVLHHEDLVKKGGIALSKFVHRLYVTT